MYQPMGAEFNVDLEEWQARKKARIEEMRKPQSKLLWPYGYHS
jgi:hypothetical protein